VSGRDGEAAKVINAAGFFRRDEVGEAVLELAGGFFGLLAKKVEGLQNLCPQITRIRRIDFDAIPDTVRGPEADDGFGGVALFLHDPREHRLGVGVELGGLLADDGILQDVREAAVEFPGGEERGPVDVLDDFVERQMMGEGSKVVGEG